jgi:hypothetical protein
MRNIKEDIKKSKRGGRKLQPQYFKVNIDAAKAFDSLLRHEIILLLEKLDFNRTLINAIG